MDRVLQCQLQGRDLAFDVEAAIRGMVFNRCLDPHSKRGAYEWLCEDADFPEINGLGLHHFYRCMQDLFSLDVSVVFYDATLIPSYGNQSELIEFSRNGEPEFLLTLALSREGLPFAHELYPGNTSDVTTVSRVAKALKRRFQVRHCVFVADRGMLSHDNLEELRRQGLHYIVGCPMRRAGEVRDQVLATPGRYREIKEDLHIKEVWVDERRYMVCYNPVEAARDGKIRQSIVEELEAEIEDLDPASKEAARLYSHRAKGRFLRRLKDGTLRLDKGRIREEARYDGKYVIRTSHKTLEPDELANAYKDLMLIERSFRSLKSLEEINPVYHWRTRRIKAHVHICVLAHLLERYLEKRLQAAGLKMTATEALRHLGRIHSVHFAVKDEFYRLRTQASPEAAAIFQALGYRPPSRIEPIRMREHGAKNRGSRAPKALG